MQMEQSTTTDNGTAHISQDTMFSVLTLQKNSSTRKEPMLTLGCLIMNKESVYELPHEIVWKVSWVVLDKQIIPLLANHKSFWLPKIRHSFWRGSLDCSVLPRISIRVTQHHLKLVCSSIFGCGHPVCVVFLCGRLACALTSHDPVFDSGTADFF